MLQHPVAGDFCPGTSCDYAEAGPDLVRMLSLPAMQSMRRAETVMLIGITDTTPLTMLWLCISILLPAIGATSQQCQLLAWLKDPHLGTAELILLPVHGHFPLSSGRGIEACARPGPREVR